MNFQLRNWLGFLLLLWSSICHSQTRKADTVASIRSYCTQVDKLGNLNPIKLENESFFKPVPPHGSTQTVYFQGDSIVKMEVVLGNARQEVRTLYYFRLGELVYAWHCVRPRARSKSVQKTDAGKLGAPLCARFFYHSGRVISSSGAKSLKAPNALEARRWAENAVALNY